MIFLGLSCFLSFKSSSSVCGCEEQSNIICLSDNLHPRTGGPALGAGRSPTDEFSNRK